jgi:hypothetical protein
VNEKSIDRILDAVRADLPAGFDRLKFSPRRERTKRLSQVAAAATTLRELLSDDEGRWVAERLAPQYSSVEGASFEGFVAGLAQLELLAKSELSSGRTNAKAPWRQERSPFEWLAGEKLPKIFEKHFAQEAGYTKDAHQDGAAAKADSPYIRFAIAVLEGLGVKLRDGRPYAQDTIAKALADARSGRLRRHLKSPSSKRQVS